MATQWSDIHWNWTDPHFGFAAARCSSAVEQMCLVAAFSVSSYSTTVHRIAKPFNPMLGETFELDRLDDMVLEEMVWGLMITP